MISDRKKIEIMQHFANGGKIEYRDVNFIKEDDWCDCSLPAWNWEDFEYRIKKTYTEYQQNVIDHYDNGGEIQVRSRGTFVASCNFKELDFGWCESNNPTWDWKFFDYRIKPGNLKKKVYLFAIKSKNEEKYYISIKFYENIDEIELEFNRKNYDLIRLDWSMIEI